MIKYHIIDSGYFMADGGAMFGPIPKMYWERKYPCNENNLCVMAMRCLFVVTENRRMLIDTGLGNKNELTYYQPHNLKDIVDELNIIGFEPKDITDVVLTHLHFDHCGYATCFDENKKITTTFPNATYWMSQAQWDNYRNPRLYEKDAFFPENIEPIYDANQLSLIEKDIELFEGFTLKLYDGHTPGQIAAFIDTDNELIVYPGDVVPTSAHVSLGWVSAFDNNAALAMEEKKRLLDKVIEENRTVIFYHDAHIVSAKVESKNNYYFLRHKVSKA